MLVLDDAGKAEQQRRAAQQLMSLLGLGAVGGFGLRGAMGLHDMMTDQNIPVASSANIPRTISVYGEPQHPDVPFEEPPQKKNQFSGMPKLAIDWKGLGSGYSDETPDAPAGNTLMDGLKSFGQSAGQFAQQAGDAIGKVPGQIADAVAPHLPPTPTTKPLANEWGMPLGMLALGAGGAGGYKAMDWLLSKEQENAGDRDVHDAEDDYHKALAEQYRAAMMAKAGEDELGLHNLADLYVEQKAKGHEKMAFGQSLIEALYPPIGDGYSKIVGYDNWQAAKGGANMAAVAAMLGTGKLTYDWAKGQNKHELLAKALKKRQMMRQSLSPAPILALPEASPDIHAA